MRASELIGRLDRLKMQFDRASTVEKQRALRTLRDARLASARDLLAYHDALCVIRAYPESRSILEQAERELSLFGDRVEAYCRARRGRAAKLRDTGLVGTSVVHPFSFELTRHLVSWHPGRLEIAWEDVEDEQLDSLASLLSQLVIWTETDSIDYDPAFEVRDWLGRARGGTDATDLETLVRLLEGSGIREPLQRYLFDQIELPLRWDVGQATANRTHHRLPAGRIFYQREPRRGRCRDLRAELKRKATPLRLLPATQGRMYIRALQEAHAVRNRELFPIVFASPREVYLSEPGRGLQVVLFGMTPDMRLPFESNYGALLIRNGVPVGYGVASPWFERTEVAINVFPAYRSGESAYAFEELCRLFHHHFGSSAIYVRSHQMGEDDEEPLQSGTFWFYYKLGFRAVNPTVRRRAEREAQRMHRNPRYRCSLETLKKLSHTDVYLHVDASRREPHGEVPLVDLAYAVTDYVARVAAGDRTRATRRAVQQVMRALSFRDLRRWTRDEVVALERLAPLLASIPGLAKWSAKDKRDLAEVIRAKGGQHERQYVLRCIRHPRLRAALEELGASTRASKPGP